MKESILVIYGLKNIENIWDSFQATKYILVEDDPEIFEAFQNTTFGRELLKKKDVQNFFLKETFYREMVLKEISFEIAFAKFDFFINEASRERGERFLQDLEIVSEGTVLTLGYFQDFGMSGCSNLFSNFLKNFKIKLLRDFKGSFQGIPAIICGGGPSLEKEIPFLRAVQDRALIFAGGSALNSLNYYSIVPHFAGGVDKDAPEVRFKGQNRGEIPFIFTSNFAKDNLAKWDGPLILSGENSISEEVFNFFRGGEESGWNVATFLVGAAVSLGCNPIFLVGVDLGFEKERYASGVNDKIGFELIQVESKDGKIYFTQRDWLAARNWLTRFAKNKIETSFFNLSDAALPIETIPKKLSQDVKEEYFKTRVDLIGKVHTLFQNKSDVNLSDDIGYLALQKSLKSTLKLLKKREGVEKELQKEIAYICLLEPLWKLFGPIFNKQVIEGDEISPKLVQDFFFRDICNKYVDIMGRLWKDMR